MTTNQKTLNQFIKIEKNPLPNYINQIVSDGFLIVENEKKNIGTLFFEKGKLINGEINNKFGNKTANEIMSWKKGNYFFQKWQKHFNIKSKYASKLFYFIEFLSLNAKISFNIDNNSFVLLFSEGAIVDTIPEINNEHEIKDILNKIQPETEIKIEKTKINNGDFKIYFSELGTEDISQNEKSTNKKKTNISNNTPKEKNKVSENKTYKTLKNNFTNILNDIQTYFDNIEYTYIHSTKDNKEIFSQNFNTNQKQHLNLLKKIIIENTNNSITASNYLIIEMKEKILISFFFENYNIFIMFDKKNLNFGMVFNILIPQILSIKSK